MHPEVGTVGVRCLGRCERLVAAIRAVQKDQIPESEQRDSITKHSRCRNNLSYLKMISMLRRVKHFPFSGFSRSFPAILRFFHLTSPKRKILHLMNHENYSLLFSGSPVKLLVL